MHLDTAHGAAQVSLAKLGDEQAMKELDQELNGKRTFGRPTTAISKLLFVANGRAIKLLTTYLAAHPEPIMVGYEVDHPYDLRHGLIVELANMVEYADDKAYGKHPRSTWEWEDSWKHGKATPFRFPSASICRIRIWNVSAEKLSGASRWR